MTAIVKRERKHINNHMHKGDQTQVIKAEGKCDE